LNHKEFSDYIEKLNSAKGTPEIIGKIVTYARESNIPAIRNTTAKILYTLAVIKQPKRVLEIGTGSGFSTIAIASGAPQSAEIITLERDKKRFDKAKDFFRDYPNIEIIYIDALKYLEKNNKAFDFVFLDAQKRDYINFLSLIEKCLADTGIFVADNLLFGGRVIHIPEEDKPKYGEGARLLHKFNTSLAENPSFDTTFLPVDDGIAIAIKRKSDG
jgi:caffeoyl-CoA O-methyltransferase